MQGTRIPFPGGQVLIAPVPDAFPLGGRGARPIQVFTDPSIKERADEVRALRIPGVSAYGTTFKCAWDAAPVVMAALGYPTVLDAEYARREALIMEKPGLDMYKAKGLDQVMRKYQKQLLAWLLRRAYAIIADPPRAGKTLPMLALTVLLSSKRTLIVSPALAKYEWASQLKRWLGEPGVLLFGRGGDEARVHCITCDGSTLAPMTEGTREYEACPSCRALNGQALGEKIVRVRELTAVTAAHKWQEASNKLKKDGTPRMVWRSARYTPLPAVFVCSVHPDVQASRPGTCPRCSDDLDAVLSQSRYVIVNYDLLAPQKDKKGNGRGFIRADLPGWGPRLAKHEFDIAIADEAHKLRGHKQAKEADATTRREAFVNITERIERVFLVTATPIYTFTRDLWGLLDACSGGLWS